LKVHDETLRVLKSAVTQAKLGNDETLMALRRLDQQASVLERTATGPTFEHRVEVARAPIGTGARSED
jgi:uncharacterized protein